jgi:tetratricopeptide (TPR) repeat protein
MDHWSRSHEPERGLVFADELLRVDPLSPLNLFSIAGFQLRLGRLDEMERTLDRIRSIDPKSTSYLWGAWNLAIVRGDLVEAIRLGDDYAKVDPADSEAPSGTALHYFDLGDVVTAKYWSEVALKLDPRAPMAKLVAALFHLDRNEEAKAIEIARELTQPDAMSRGNRGFALRIAEAPELAAGRYEEVIARYLTEYPDLGDGKVPTEDAFDIEEAFVVALSLASVYLQAGEETKAETLLAATESEMAYWPQVALGPGSGFAMVDLHILRGEKENALAALREGAANGTRYRWRVQLLYNLNLESLRDDPEFQAVIAEIEADMAEQLARVREMERNGELEPIPEVSAATQ